MTNKEFAKLFSELASLMELHNENTFKIKSYSNAYLTLRKLDGDINEMSEAELEAIPGVGKAIASKIMEVISTGHMATLEKYREMTPEGVREMLKVNGLGPKKIDAIWRKLNISSPGELLYACNENRLIELSGFGTKTQQEVKSRLEFFFNSSGKYLYARVIECIQPIIERLNLENPELQIDFTGQVRRKCEIIDDIKLICVDLPGLQSKLSNVGELAEKDQGIFSIKLENDMNLQVIAINRNKYGVKMFEATGPLDFCTNFDSVYKIPDEAVDEQAIFELNSLPFFAPTLRDNDLEVNKFITERVVPELITYKDIKGVIHNHSTWSDGIHTLEDMANHVRNNGFEYFVISDHSKSAFYANGLSVERVEAQWNEIDLLNRNFNNFKIFKSIESDILSDGQLDYADDILKGFDLVIASIHSNLNMDETKSMKRLISAIENPYTRILGHPTGRLLLSRSGYPIDHVKLIDACAANNVVIELNANPLRLDIDWKWIPYALEKSVMIAINPDAHSKSGIFDIQFGINVAQKAGLGANNCLNCLNTEQFEHWVGSK